MANTIRPAENRARRNKTRQPVQVTREAYRLRDTIKLIRRVPAVVLPYKPTHVQPVSRTRWPFHRLELVEEDTTIVFRPTLELDGDLASARHRR